MIERAKTLLRAIEMEQMIAQGFRADIEAIEQRLANKESDLDAAVRKIEAWQSELEDLAESHPEVAAYLEDLEAWREAVDNPHQMKLPFLEVATP